MKLVSHYLQEITGVQIYPLISFILFFTIFMLVLFVVIRTDKKYMKEMAAMPLESENNFVSEDYLTSNTSKTID